ncbi:MAG: formate dehydrogenase accessory sulfurtransferase FdhD [Vicinamibacterales bacterium]
MNPGDRDRAEAVAGAGVRDVTLERVRPDARTAGVDRIAVEEPMEVRVNGEPFAVVMRTPGADPALAAGFLLAEDVVREPGELGAIEVCEDAEGEARGNTLNVTVIGDAVGRLAVRLGERRQVMMTASCGLCGRRTIDTLRARVGSVAGRWTIGREIIASLPQRLRASQRVFDATGGLHAAGLFDRAGRLELVAEDVGRHNAVDKIVGRRLLDERLPLDESVLIVSGRTSYELVQKTLLAGIPLIAAVSAPSSLAVQLAEESGITLCGFVRGEAFNIYAHPERIV